MKRIIFFVFISLILVLTTSAQVVEHTVQKKETLFKIAKNYNTTVEAILKANPGLTEAITVGQVIKIPDGKGVTIEPKPAAPAGVAHLVQKGETLFSIARQYNITLDELKKENPGITENLQPGTKLNIPAKAKITEPQTQNPVPAEKFECGKTGLLESYKVALLIPFYLEHSYKVDTSAVDDKKSKNRLPLSLSFISFYEGLMMASDSLEKAGVNVKYYVYDVPEDTSLTSALFDKPEMKEMNLIIGPFFSNNFRIVGKWAKEHHIKIINPFSNNAENVRDNPCAIKLMCSGEDEVRGQVRYILDTWPGANIFLVHNNRPKDSLTLKFFRENLDKLNAGDVKGWTEVLYSKEGLAGISKNLSKEKVNVIISVVDGEAFLNNYIRNLSELTTTYPIVVFGNRNWETYSSLEGEYIMNIKLHICTNTLIDFSKSNVQNFVLKYRNDYNAEPDTFAFRGYDIAMFFVSALNKYGKDFEKCISDYHPELLQENYLFERKEGRGLENTLISIYRHDNYRIIDARKEPLTTVPLVEKKTR